MGKWRPVHNEEWDGLVPLNLNNDSNVSLDDDTIEEGEVVFKGETLPWNVGTYELRYHHDGKHNVLSIAGPIQIYGTHANCRDGNMRADFPFLSPKTTGHGFRLCSTITPANCCTVSGR